MNLLRNIPTMMLASLSLCIGSFSCLSGQEINMGRHDSLYSEVLKETRKIWISLPDDYETSGKTYPVLYRLDGSDDLFPGTVGTVRRLSDLERVIPEMIVVLIGNTDRGRDMMPTTTSYYQDEPGAERFGTFIETELIPYIDDSCPTSGEKLLCGQSFSSMFTLYWFFSHPESFNGYLACSGGFPGCEAFYFDLARKMLNRDTLPELTLFITNGMKDPTDPGSEIEKPTAELAKLIQSDGRINFEYRTYPEEGHVPYQSLYHGLKFFYGSGVGGLR
ncbi:MAG: alpha/beta hydrolase [Bacteroidales bacterium]